MVEVKEKEHWCNHCDDYVTPWWRSWETSIAKICDLECPHCSEIFERKFEQKDLTTERKTKRERLELEVHFALWNLSNYFKLRDDPLQYEVNYLWHRFDRLRSIPLFPKPPS